MTDASYNKFSAIAIGGTYVNNIPTIYGNVSLDVSGHTAIRGNLYISGTANIDVSGGGFSGTDLSLNGNIYLGGDLYSSNALSSMNIYANTITNKSGDGTQTNIIQYYDPTETIWEGQKNFTINTVNGKYFNATSGGSMGFDASQNLSFMARNGQISFKAEQADILLDASSSIEITSRKSDISLYPRNGVNGNVIVNGQIQLSNGIKCTEASNILTVTNSQYFDIYGTGGLTQIDLYPAGSTAKSVSVGLNTTTNSGYIGSAGTNVDFSIGTGRYIRLQQPIYVDYVYADISRSNWQIGWTQNTANPNTGTTFSGTASDTGTPAQVATFDLPSFGVWLIQFNCLLTLNTGSDTINDRGITLSDTTASNTPCAPGFRMTDPIDDAAGGSGGRQTYSFSGVYHHTAPSTAAKFINVYAVTSGSRTVTASGSYKYTRIA